MAKKTADSPTLVVTSSETARLLGVSAKTLSNWRSQGRGPRYLRLGAAHGGVRYRRSDLEAWIDEQMVGGER